jgi:hypothetical protein
VIAVIEERIIAAKHFRESADKRKIRAKFTGVDLAEEIFSIYLHFVFAPGRDGSRQQP